MSVFDCFWELFSTSNAAIEILWYLWCLMTIIGWIFSVSFIYYFVKRVCNGGASLSGSQLKTRNIYGGLMISSVIFAALLLTTSLVASIFWTHLLNGYMIAPNVDYTNDLDQCYPHFTVKLHVFAMLDGIFFDIACILILVTYYYRLETLFKASIYQISNIKSNIFKVLMSLFLIMSMVHLYLLFVQNAIVTTVFTIELTLYLVISIYLVYLLKTQSDRLRSDVTRMTARSTSVSLDGHGQKDGTHASVHNPQFDQFAIFDRLVLLGYICLLTNILYAVSCLLVYQVLAIEDSYIEELAYWTIVFINHVTNIASISLQYPKFGYFEIIYKLTCQKFQYNRNVVKVTNNLEKHVTDQL